MGSPAGPAVLEPQKATATDETPRLAPLYRVLIHNDDVTPMGLVVHVLMSVFKKNSAEATDIMLEAHHTGVALVVVLPLEEAELRVDQAHALARTEKFPLTLTIEPE
ncbi:MAG: ATP-dependent Clp protease adaptor ClpS [Planctomycetota bacterium]|nr:ATP-dependent Clp protease adaptor ClpS [Planctomycetota bacterium]